MRPSASGESNLPMTLYSKPLGRESNVSPVFLLAVGINSPKPPARSEEKSPVAANVSALRERPLQANARPPVEMPRLEIKERLSIFEKLRDSINITLGSPIFNVCMNEITIRQAETGNGIAAAKEIFREYESWLGLD